jgi:YidC/Oxa1 family membrane protein insertase
MTLLSALLADAATTTTTVASSAHKSSGSILDPIAKPIAWVLAEIYSVIPNYGVAIMVLSVIWMLIIAPLTLKSTRSMLAMQQLQPQLKKLQEQHKNDRQAFAQAQMELFREHQVSPFGSCLPMLLPLPVFFALFRVIDGLSHTVSSTSAAAAGLPGCNPATMATCSDPKYLNHSSRMFNDIVAAHGQIVAFGMDLAKSPLSHHGSFLAAAPFYILLLIMAATSYLQSAQMMSRNLQAQSNPQMKMMKYLGPLFALICIRFPAGVILYYTMSNICRIIQQDAMYRFDPKVKALVASEVAEVEEITQEIDDREVQRKGYTPPRGAKPDPSPKAPPPARQSKPPAKSGRSRFADMLAAAQEEQRRKQQEKPGSAKSGNANGRGQPAGKQPGAQPGGAGSQGTGAGGRDSSNGNGAAKPGGPPRSQSGGGRGQPRPGGRTNRKRRGR